MKKDKHIDYYDVILEQEKKSHKLAKDLETGAKIASDNLCYLCKSQGNICGDEVCGKMKENYEKIKNRPVRETSSEDRKDNMIERVVNLDRIGRDK